MLFEKATRMRLRWPYRGLCNVEDLWDLDVEDLDAIYKTLNRKRKAEQEDSLLAERTGEDEKLTLKIEIVKHIVETMLAEAEARKEAAKKAAKRQKIMAIMEQKQEQAMMDMGLDELKNMLDEL